MAIDERFREIDAKNYADFMEHRKLVLDNIRHAIAVEKQQKKGRRYAPDYTTDPRP